MMAQGMAGLACCYTYTYGMSPLVKKSKHICRAGPGTRGPPRSSHRAGGWGAAASLRGELEPVVVAAGEWCRSVHWVE